APPPPAPPPPRGAPRPPRPRPRPPPAPPTPGSLPPQPVRRPARVVGRLEAPAHQQPLHLLADRPEHRRYLGIARWRRPVKGQRAPGRLGEHPVQHEGVKM